MARDWDDGWGANDDGWGAHPRDWWGQDQGLKYSPKYACTIKEKVD